METRILIESMSEKEYKLLKAILGKRHFFFNNVSADKIVFSNKDKEELEALMEEKDYFSIKQFMHKFRQ